MQLSGAGCVCRLTPPTAHPTQAVRRGPLRRVRATPGPGLPEAVDSALLPAASLGNPSSEGSGGHCWGCPQTLCQLACLFQSSLNEPKAMPPPSPPPTACSALIHENGAHRYSAHSLRAHTHTHPRPGRCKDCQKEPGTLYILRQLSSTLLLSGPYFSQSNLPSSFRLCQRDEFQETSRECHCHDAFYFPHSRPVPFCSVPTGCKAPDRGPRGSTLSKADGGASP